jgi:hypothetical protein
MPQKLQILNMLITTIYSHHKGHSNGGHKNHITIEGSVFSQRELRLHSEILGSHGGDY